MGRLESDAQLLTSSIDQPSNGLSVDQFSSHYSEPILSDTSATVESEEVNFETELGEDILFTDREEAVSSSPAVDSQPQGGNDPVTGSDYSTTFDTASNPVSSDYNPSVAIEEILGNPSSVDEAAFADAVIDFEPVTVGDTEMSVEEIMMLSEDEIASLVGSMTEEEYDDFVAGIEAYTDKQIAFLTSRKEIIDKIVDELKVYDFEYKSRSFEQLIEDYHSSIRRILDARITGISNGDGKDFLDSIGMTKEEFEDLPREKQYELLEKSDPVVQSNKEYQQIQGALQEYIKWVNSVVEEELGEKYDIHTYQEFLDNYNYLKALSVELQQSINMLTNIRDSAQYDYLFYKQSYANFEYKTEFTEEELAAVENDSKVDLESGELIYDESNSLDDLKKKYSYTNYHKLHPEVSPVEYIKMVQQLNPSGFYNIYGIPNLNQLKDFIELESYGLDFAKKADYLYKKYPDMVSEYVKKVQYQINNFKGQIKANDFLKNLAEMDEASFWDYISNAFQVNVQGLMDGLISYGEGVGYSFEALMTLLGISEENRILSDEEYKRMYILQALLNYQTKKENGLITTDENGKEVSSSSFIDFRKQYAGFFLSNNYELSQGIGNMLPSIILSAFNPCAGMFALGISAGGNAYHGAMVDGKSFLDSFMYGVFTGTSEAITERIFGGIPLLSDVKVVSLKTFFGSMAREAFQESFQGVGDLLYKAIFMDEPLPDINDAEGWKKVALELGKEGLYGALTAGILNVPSLAISSANFHRLRQYMKTYNITQAQIDQAIADFKTTHPEYANLSNREIQLTYTKQILLKARVQAIMSTFQVSEAIALESLAVPPNIANSMLYYKVDAIVAQFLINNTLNEREFLEFYRTLAETEDVSDPQKKLNVLNQALETYNILHGSIEDIISHWNTISEENLETYFNKNGYQYSFTIEDVKQFMEQYGDLAIILAKNDNIRIVLNRWASLPENERLEYLRQYCYDKFFGYDQSEGGQISFDSIDSYKNLTNEDFLTLFQYFPFDEFLNSKVGEFYANKLLLQIEQLGGIEVFLNMGLPLNVLFEGDVLKYVSVFGLQNIINFDKENGNFFTKNNCENLRKMFDLYMHYAGNEHDTLKNIYCDKDGHYVTGLFTKEQFYESLRRMILYGPSDGTLLDNAIDFSGITGEFREQNPDLFLSEDAPVGLKDLWYHRKLTMEDLANHPEYAKYLNEKNLQVGFKAAFLYVSDSTGAHYVNFYQFLSDSYGLDNAVQFIVDNYSLLEYLFQRGNNETVQIQFDGSTSLQDQFFAFARQLILKRRSSDAIVDYSGISGKFREQNPDLFLSEDAPEGLKYLFYHRKLTLDDLINHPEYIEYLRDKSLIAGFPSIDLYVDGKTVDLYNHLMSKYDFDEVMAFLTQYSDLLLFALKQTYSDTFYVSSTDDIPTMIEKLMAYSDMYFEAIMDGREKYNEKIYQEFKDKYPFLFLDDSVPQEIRDKYYRKEFTYRDFQDHPEWLEYFNNTNIALGFSSEYAWLSRLFSNDDIQTANEKKLQVLEYYNNLNDGRLKKVFSEYLSLHSNTVDIENIDTVKEVLYRLQYSNAIELSSFKDTIAQQIMELDDPLEALNQIEDVFLRNNLPLFGKMFLCFQILYPNLSLAVDKAGGLRFNFSDDGRTAPMLKDESLPNIGFHLTNDEKRALIIFNDLLRISYRTGERTLVEYLNNIEVGNELYYQLQESNWDISQLTPEQLEILEIFVSHLEVLYSNSVAGQNDSVDFSSLSLEEKLKLLGEKFKETSRYSLKDRIVRSFCYFAGIESFEQLRNLIESSAIEQQQRIEEVLAEIERDGRFEIHNGDFIRCIGGLEALAGSLDSGNFSKEFLGVFNGTSGSDTTPLDTDWTLVSDDSSLYDSVNGTPTGWGFGNVFFVIRSDNPNVTVSRDSDGNLTGSSYNPSQIEMFGSKQGNSGTETHWGARTGVSLADVDCIIYKENRMINFANPYDENGNVNYVDDPTGKAADDLAAIKFEIARHGMYIPIVDFSGKLIFTLEEYNALREQMQGLSYYNNNSYDLSPELVTPEIEEVAKTLTDEAAQETNNKRNQINQIVKDLLAEMGIDMRNYIDGDLTSGFVEFVDTGSTGRGTNIPGDGDFDFFMRLDSEIMSNPEAYSQFKNQLVELFKRYGVESIAFTDRGDLRMKGVHLPDGSVVDVDISFGVKTNKLQYSSDESLRDRLETIKTIYPDQYDYVVANIIFAKEFLKSIDAYKPRRTDSNQGGLGGVGVENWILQNGGSFTEACRAFLAAALDENGNIKPFGEFAKDYQIWDFGENHFSARDGEYLHDNFITDNMNQTGYEKMVKAIQEYLNSLE